MMFVTFKEARFLLWFDISYGEGRAKKYGGTHLLTLNLKMEQLHLSN